MTVEDNAKKEEQPQPAQVEEEFKTPEDEAFEEAQRQLEEAERAEAEASDKGEEDKAEAEEFEQVAEEATGEGDKAGDDESDDKTGETVPLAVLLEERNQAREDKRALELELARKDGQLSAMQSQPTDKGEPNPTEPSPEEQIAKLNDQIDEIYDQADEGELTLKEVRQKSRALQEQIDAIKAKSAPQAQDAQTVVMDVRIEENLVELEGKYPILKALDEQQMGIFVKQAYQQAEEEGKPIRDGALDTMRLHNMAAKAAHDHYAQFYPAPQPEAGQQGKQPSEQPSPTGQQSGQGGLSPLAKARSDKMDLAAGHPPDINQIGSAAEGALTDAQIQAKLEGMSEDEQIEFLETMPGLAQRLGVQG